MIRPDTDDLIAFLNELVAIDPYAVAELLATRVPCNAELAAHPTVQVSTGGVNTKATFIRPGESRVGALGILNGYCGAIESGEHAGWGPITAEYEDDCLMRFRRTDCGAPFSFLTLCVVARSRRHMRVTECYPPKETSGLNIVRP